MYKCLECGHIFDEGEEKRWEERHGLDLPPFEQMSGCPVCLSAYDETVSCKKCGGEFLRDELEGFLCEDCLAEEYENEEMEGLYED